MTEPERWTCPDCGRSFKHPNQWHSCTTNDLENHFAGKSDKVRTLFDELIGKLKSSQSFKLTPLKSAVYLTAHSHFAAVFIRKNHLVLEFSNENPFMDERVHRTEKVSGTLYSHFANIRSDQDIDTQLIEWIQEAYELTGK